MSSRTAPGAARSAGAAATTTTKTGPPTSPSSTATAATSRVKCVVVGDGGVGKTCLAAVLAQGRFPSGAYVPTTFDSHTVSLALSPGTFVEISLWDCAGQPEFDQVRHYAYFPTLDVFVLCFSLVDRRTLEHCERRWQREIRSFDADVPVVMVGTKADLRDRDGGASHADSDSAKGAVSSRDGREMASRIGAARYIEVSAKAGRNVKAVFEAAAELALKRRRGGGGGGGGGGGSVAPDAGAARPGTDDVSRHDRRTRRGGGGGGGGAGTARASERQVNGDRGEGSGSGENDYDDDAGDLVANKRRAQRRARKHRNVDGSADGARPNRASAASASAADGKRSGTSHRPRTPRRARDLDDGDAASSTPMCGGGGGGGSGCTIT